MTLVLSDGEAKRRMRDRWPIYAQDWLGTTARWVRLLPFPVERGPRQPYLHRPGGALVTNPDGMFGSFGDHHVDLLIMEHCGGLQNFYDKRSRYGLAHDGLLLALPKAWREDWEGCIKGGRGGTWREFGEIVQLSRDSKVPPWTGVGYYAKAGPAETDWKFAVRTVLCCYFLKPSDKQTVEQSGNALGRHEYVTQHGRLGQITHAAFRDWLGAALAARHIY